MDVKESDLPENIAVVREQIKKERAQEKEEMEKARKHLKGGQVFRGTFGGRRIELPENLLKAVENISRECQRKKLSNSSISQLIQDAIVAMIFQVQDSGCLIPDDYFYPGEEWLATPSNIVERVVRNIHRPFKREDLISSLRDKFPDAFQHVDDKTLKNYISKQNGKIRALKFNDSS